jgi:putative transcriptional regulator
MTIAHHPSDETLAAFASGTLDEPAALVIASHLTFCANCRRVARTGETAGGVLLERLEPTPLEDSALEAVLSRLDTDATPRARPAAERRSGARPDPMALLAPYAKRPWRSIGGGVRIRTIDVPGETNNRLFLLQAAGGTRLPHHKHTDREWTCVLEGAFRHEHGRYGLGDFDEADDTVEHHPVVEPEGPCICLVAMRGEIILQGWLGRLIQPFVRL